MKFNFIRAAFAAVFAMFMIGNVVAIGSGSSSGSSSSPSGSGSSSPAMPGSYSGGTVVQPGSNPGAVNPPPPAPQTPGYYNGRGPNEIPQDGMMGSPPPAQMQGETLMGPDGLPQDGSTTTVSPPPGRSMAPPAGPMGPQNSPAPGPQSKAKLKGKQVSKR